MCGLAPAYSPSSLAGVGGCGAAGGNGRHYAVLGVEPGATPEQLRAAYRAAILRLHPDKVADTAASKAASGSSVAAASGAAAPGFQDVQLAWEVRHPLAGRVLLLDTETCNRYIYMLYIFAAPCQQGAWFT